MTKHITQASLYSAVKTIIVKVELYVLPERCMKEQTLKVPPVPQSAAAICSKWGVCVKGAHAVLI